MNLNIFPNHGGAYKFKRKFNRSCRERGKALRSLKKEFILGNYDTLFIYYFVDPGLGEMYYSSKKRGQQKKGALILK